MVKKFKKQIIALIFIIFGGGYAFANIPEGIGIGTDTASSTPKIVINYSVRDSLRDDIQLNEKVNEVSEIIEESQNSFYKKNNKYWHSLKTHNVIPEKGMSSVVTNKDSKTLSQKESLKELGFNYNTLPFQVDIHQYKEFQSDRTIATGYQIIFRIKDGDDIYVKSVAFGDLANEPSKNFNWRK